MNYHYTLLRKLNEAGNKKTDSKKVPEKVVKEKSSKQNSKSKK